MAERRRAGFPDDLLAIFHEGSCAGLDDADLLGRFNAGAGGAESAFAALVGRHGPMVLRSCRAILRDDHAAADAFQAVFLVLAKKARSVRVDGTLAPWLHRVACRAALTARSAAIRRREQERIAALAGRDKSEPDAEALAIADEAGAIVHEEVDRLPTHYRDPIVLCHLEGRTHDEAALLLGWPVGTVRSRLARGRERLRARLKRRGWDDRRPTSPPAIVSVPAALAFAATRGAVRGHGGESTVVSLGNLVMRSLMMDTIRRVAAVVAIAMTCGGAIALPRLFARESPPAVAAAEFQPQPEPTPIPPPMPLEVVAGTIRDADGRPVAGAQVVATIRHREVMLANGRFHDFVRESGPYSESDDAGRYRLDGARLPAARPPGGFGLFAIHDAGYVRRSADELAESTDLTLDPWGRIEGTIRVGGKPQARASLRITIDATDRHSMFYDILDYDATTDADGRYVVPRVPAGLASVSVRAETPVQILSSSRGLVEPGKTLTLDIGATGRPVVGRIALPEGIPASAFSATLERKTGLELPKVVTINDEDKSLSEAVRGERVFFRNLASYRSPSGRAYRLATRTYRVKLRNDGTLRVEDVDPGEYTLIVRIGRDGNPANVDTREVTVPATPELRSDAPHDLGEIRLGSPAGR